MIGIIEPTELESMLRRIVREEIGEMRAKILSEPDTTVLSDEAAAARLRVSVSTLRRMKKNREIGYIATPKGRLVRVCDIVSHETYGLL